MEEIPVHLPHEGGTSEDCKSFSVAGTGVQTDGRKGVMILIQRTFQI